MIRQFELRDVTQIDFYSIYLTMNIYERAFPRLLEVDPKVMKQAMRRKADSIRDYDLDNVEENSDGDKLYDKARREMVSRANHRLYGCWACRKSLMEKYQEAVVAKDLRGQLEMINEIIYHLSDKLLWEDLVKFVGHKNVFIQARINGFRHGDENAPALTRLHEPFISNSSGEFGSRKTHGPINYIKYNLGMTDSEMFLLWMMESI